MAKKQLVGNTNSPIPFVAPEVTAPILECENALVKCAYLEPGQESPPHTHKFVDVMIISKGSGVATVDGEERRVGPGDFILNPAGTRHGIRNDGTERLTWIVVHAPISRSPKAG
jgi:quercetin dioxygenase-like cupin family protein